MSRHDYDWQAGCLAKSCFFGWTGYGLQRWTVYIQRAYRSAIGDRLDHKLGATLLGQARSGQQNIFIRSRLKYQWGRQTRPVSAGSSRFSNPSLDFRTKAFFVTPCSIWLSKKVEPTMRSAKDFGSVLRFLYWSVAEPDTQVHSELFKLIVLNLSKHLAPVPFGLLQHFVALAA